MSRRARCRWRAVAVVAAVALIGVVPVRAAVRAVVIASGFTRPVALVFDPYFAGVAYVVQQNGLVRTMVDGVVQPTPFLDLRTQVTTAGNEQGLLGMAFAPDVASGRVFVQFTDGNGDTVIARFRRTAAAPYVADPASRFDLRWPDGRRVIGQPTPNQNGGHLLFGPDGFLYVGTGDGSLAYDPDNLAQSPTSLLGKMLRIDVGVPDGDAAGYRIPPGNPFAAIAGVHPEIWAFGLRNPWRYSFDDAGPGATGALFIGDVGQVSREEIDHQPAGRGGRNYGWRLREGAIVTPNPAAGATPPAYLPLTAPLFDYAHDVGSAVTGGYVYRGTQLRAALHGRYVHGDCTSGRVWSLGVHVDPVTGEATAGGRVDYTPWLGPELGCITSFARDAGGELYLTSFAFATGEGQVFALRPELTEAPAAPVDVAARIQGRTVRITWAAAPAGGTPQGYTLEATTPWGQVVAVDTAVPELVAPDVPDGRYVVRIRARNAAGESTPAADVAVDVGCVAPPAAPLFTAAVAGRVVTLGWTAPPGATALRIEAGFASGGVDAAVFTVPAAPSSIAVQAPDGVYFVRARAATACGAGAPSADVRVVVPAP